MKKPMMANVVEIEVQVLNERLNKMNELLEIQGRLTEEDSSDYMIGLYNGMELMLSVIEDRKLKLKDLPEVGDLSCGR